MPNYTNFLSLYDGKRGWKRTADLAETLPTDDGSHIEDSNDQWEWWYFDFSFDNGFKAVVTFHYHNMFLLPHLPTMQLFIYPPAAPPIVKMWAVRPDQENSAAKDHCSIKMGGLSAEDTGDGYHLQMDMGSTGLDVWVTNELPGWKAGSGLLWKEDSKQTGWVVPVPRGKVNGVLKLEGISQQVSGSAYHDHNWGNLELEEKFWGWYWGRIFDPSFTLIYGWVIPKDSAAPIVSPFLLGKDGNIILGTDQINVTIEETRKDEQYGCELPLRLRLTCHGEGIHIDGVLSTERIVETLRLPRANGSFYHYYRFLATYQALIEIDGMKYEAAGETLHEFMRLE